MLFYVMIVGRNGREISGLKRRIKDVGLTVSNSKTEYLHPKDSSDSMRLKKYKGLSDAIFL